MTSETDVRIATLAGEYRLLLPEGFLEERNAVEADLANGRPVDWIQTKGQEPAKNRTISKAVLAELSVFLCTNDSRYEGLRRGAHDAETTVASAIGKVVGTALDLNHDVATGCVLFLWQVCRKVGVDNFCRLCPPPSPPRTDA